MNTVTVDHVCEALSTWTGIPADRLRPGGFEVGDPDTLRARLREAIIGQDAAIDAAVRAMVRRARLAPRAGERRPLWTALFAGPSGVGKTQLAKELADVFYGDVDRHLIQVDLSDFRDEHTVARLVGAPPGYKGHGEGGELTNALRRVPAGVLLLDEVEKAHPSVTTQVLIPLLGEGVVHDMNDGRIHDVTQFLVVLTSNLGTGRPAARPVGFGADTARSPADDVRRAVAGHFPREVLGRIDEVVVFEHLSEEAARGIWARETASLAARLSTGGPAYDVEVAEDVTRHLLDQAEGRIKAEGARAVRKLFDRAIADRCLELIGDGREAGRIRIDLTEDGSLRYRLEPQ